MSDARYLPVFENNFLIDNESLVPILEAGRATLREVSTICANFRQAAIASLLKTGRSRLFRLRLQRSASAFAFYLSHADQGHHRVGDSKPLLDAIAAGDWATAAAIARLSSHDWIRDEEYEEDFLFYEFLMQHAFLGASADESNALLERWETCLAGTDDRRLDVCRALRQASSEEFAEALGAYLDERNEFYAEQADLLPPEILLTEAEVSVEALAFVRLAARSGIAVESGYDRVPEPALASDAVVWPAESFKQMD